MTCMNMRCAGRWETRLLKVYSPNSTIHSYNTRQRNYPHAASRRSNIISKQITHQGIGIWSRQSQNIRNIVQKNTFKSKLKQYIICLYWWKSQLIAGSGNHWLSMTRLIIIYMYLYICVYMYTLWLFTISEYIFVIYSPCVYKYVCRCECACMFVCHNIILLLGMCAGHGIHGSNCEASAHISPSCIVNIILKLILYINMYYAMENKWTWTWSSGFKSHSEFIVVIFEERCALAHEMLNI